MRASFGHMERPDIHETRPTVEKVLQVSYLVVFKSFGYEYFVLIAESLIFRTIFVLKTFLNKISAFPGLFWDLFFLFHYKLLDYNFTMLNGDRK